MSDALTVATAVRDALAGRRDADLAAVQAANVTLAATTQLYADAVRVVALLETPTPDPTPTPTPAPGPIPADANTVQIGGTSFTLAAVNPTRTDYPGGRGPDQLVAYRAPVGFTSTNAFGTEVTVMAGQVIATIDRQATQQAAGVIVPVGGGYVLSGHGRARDWLNRYAVRGAAVEVVHLDTPAPTPTPVPVPVPVPVATGGQVSVYLKMWKSNLPGLAVVAKPGITEVRLAFMQGSPPKLVGYGSQDLAGLARDAQALRARGVAVTASIGGAGGAVDTKSTEVFLGGIAALHSAIGLDRIDFDVEASALRAADVLAIAQAAHDRWGVGTTMAPNGSNVGQYLPVAVELHKRGLLVAYSHQFYDAVVPLSAVQGRISEAVKAGLSPSVLQVGMMVGSDDRHWDLAECETNLRAIHAQWPGVGAMLWSENQSEVAEWARRMAAVLT